MFNIFFRYSHTLRSNSKLTAFIGNNLGFYYQHNFSTWSNVFVDKKVLVKSLLENSADVGKVVVIKGASSVGKTTLANHLGEFGFNKFSYDNTYYKVLSNYLLSSKASDTVIEAREALIKDEDIRKIYFGYKVNKEKYQGWQLQTLEKLQTSISTIPKNPHILIDTEIYDTIWGEAKKLLLTKQNVVVEAVFDNEGMDMLKHSFQYYHPMSIVLRYASLEENLNKCFSRNIISYKKDLLDYRHPGKIIDNYFSLYKFVPSSKMITTNKVLEKVDKASTANILEQVIEHERFLFSCLYDNIKPVHEEQMLHTLKTLQCIKDSMMQSSNEDIFVVLMVEADYIINTSCLGESGTLAL